MSEKRIILLEQRVALILAVQTACSSSKMKEASYAAGSQGKCPPDLYREVQAAAGNAPHQRRRAREG